METKPTCSHARFVVLDTRVSNMDCYVSTHEGDLLTYESEDPEEIEFPKEVDDLGISNNGSSSCVDISLSICLDCHKVF